MKPASAIPVEEVRRLRGLLFDLDDTFLTHGQLTRGAYDALWRLESAGFALVAVTGRPSGWGEVIARQWPVAGCVTENGAIAFARRGRALARLDAVDPSTRAERRARLKLLVEHVSHLVPEAELTDDVDLRRSDVTWDVGERVQLPEGRTRAVIAEIERVGARWSRSSVHLHATFDVDDKATAALRFCATELGVDPSAALVRFAFVGDSGNDGPCFATFRTTFGVANVRASIPRLSIPPRYVARLPMGEGFAEIADDLIAKRGGFNGGPEHAN